MVLNKSDSAGGIKRKLSDKTKQGSTSKKSKNGDDVDGYQSRSLFSQTCEKAGLHLKNGTVYNILDVDQAVFQRNLLKELRKDSITNSDVAERFVEGFQEYIEEPTRFHKSLLPTATSPECDSARGALQASLVKILLGIDMIQTKLMHALLEKLPELFEGDILEQGQKVNLPHLLMSQFRWLDRIINGKEITEKMLEMIGITCEEVQREIITCLPDVVEDTEHATVALALRDVLRENRQLTVPVLDSMSNLILKPELLSEVRESVLQSLISVDIDDLPVVVKFLLLSVSSGDALEVVSELRANLEFNSTTAGSKQKKKTTDRSPFDNSAQRDTEALILDTIKSAVRFQKNIGDAWIKALESVKQPSEHKVIDIFILLILHSTTRRKAVESLFRNKIRSGCFTEAYLQKVYKEHAQVLQDYFPSLLRLSEVLLRSPDLPVSYFACSLYKLTFTAFEAYHQQEIVDNLVTHIGSGFESEIDASLEILADLVHDHLPKMAPFAILVKGVLDYLDNLTVCQIRKLYFMLSALAFKDPRESGSLIQDDLHIVIRKQLSNNNLKYKRMGVIGAVMVVSSIAYSDSREENSEASTQPELSDELFRQVTSLLQLVRSSSARSSEAYALFMDELSAVVSKGQLNKRVENWISENLTPDFQDTFVVDITEEAPTECGGIAMGLLHGLDDEAEGGIAVNLLPLVTQKCSKRTGLSAYTESGVSDPLCLSPSVRLLRVCEEKQCGNLENIDALLGCPIYLTKEEVYDKLEPLSQKEKDIICSTLFYCINWFIEVVNGFSDQSDPEIKGKVITRLQNITEMQKILMTCLSVHPSFSPPLANFDLDEGIKPTVALPASSRGEGKKKAKKSYKKKVGKPVAESEDEESRDSTQLNNTTVVSQVAATQDVEKADPKDKDKPSISLSAYKPFFREIDINVFSILNTGLISRAALDTEMNTKAVTELSIQAPQLEFLLEDLCRKLNHSMLATSAKRRMFLKPKGDKKVGFSNLDQLTSLEVATQAIKLLPALCNHLEGTSGFFQTMIAENDGVIDGPGSCGPEALLMASCFQLLLQALLSIFSWNGFHVLENRDLLKEGLGVLVGRIKSTETTQFSFLDSLKTAMQYLENFGNTIPDINTAVTLLKLLITLSEKAESKELSKKLGGRNRGISLYKLPFPKSYLHLKNNAHHAEEFLKREWLGKDGEREKGAKFNEQLQIVVKSYIVYSEDPLMAAEGIAAKAIPELIEADKNGYSATYPALTRNSYPVFYRILFSELIEAVKCIPPVKQTENRNVWLDRLLRWNVAVKLLYMLVNLVKNFDGRSNLGTCIKYGRLFVDLFLRLGMPLLDQMFRTHRADIQGLLKNLQLSTRALHHMCGHSKIMKDITLTNQVPMLKRSLEGFVYRVKAMLKVNKCLEAFWLGNLKNRDLQGEEILSQSSVSRVDTTEGGGGGESDDETIPDDDDDDQESDVELDNESNESETGNDVTDPEGSYSQVY